jgi:hypothetical protein
MAGAAEGPAVKPERGSTSATGAAADPVDPLATTTAACSATAGSGNAPSQVVARSFLVASLLAWCQWLIQISPGVLVSVGVHAILAVVFSTILWSQIENADRTVLAVFGNPEEPDELDRPLDSLLPEAGADPQQSMIFQADVSDQRALFDTADMLSGVTNGTTEGESNADGLPSLTGNVTVPMSAVTKGSFTVWTDPEDPAPGQNYRIIIQIKLPDGIDFYKLRDLTGEVRGTDGFRRQIKYGIRDRRKVHDHVVQVEVGIPGARVLVKDEITVHSKLLDESQRLTLEF